MHTRGGDGGGCVTLYKVYNTTARAAVLVIAVKQSKVVIFKQVQGLVWVD